MEKEKILLGIVDDHQLFRQGLCSLLACNSSVKVLFDASNGAVMKNVMLKHPLPDVILMDIAMPVVNGYEATRWLKQTHPSVQVLALTMFEDDLPIIQMLQSGAGGYIIKESSVSELVFAIKKVAESGYFINEMVTGKLIRSIQNIAPNEPCYQLTTNETRFLQYCCSELTYKEIAAEMCLSPYTIDNYRDALFQKLELKSRTGLVLFALKNGIAKN